MVNIHINDNNNKIRINVPRVNNTVSAESSNPNNNVSSTIGNETFYNGLAKEWAISPDLVQGIDYSSKYYAGQAENAKNSLLNNESFVNVSNSLEDIVAVANDLSNIDILANTIDTYHNILLYEEIE